MSFNCVTTVDLTQYIVLLFIIEIMRNSIILHFGDIYGKEKHSRKSSFKDEEKIYRCGYS